MIHDFNHLELFFPLLGNIKHVDLTSRQFLISLLDLSLVASHKPSASIQQAMKMGSMHNGCYVANITWFCS